MCGPSLVAQAERQAAVDRSMSSRLLSSGSQVRVLPGASSGGRLGSGIPPSQQLTDMSRMVLWKRRGSAGESQRPGAGLFRHLDGVPSRPASPSPAGGPLPLTARGCSAVEGRAIRSSQTVRAVRRSAACPAKQRSSSTAPSHGKQKRSPPPTRLSLLAQSSSRCGLVQIAALRNRGSQARVLMCG